MFDASAALQHVRELAETAGGHCPRASVACVLYDERGKMLATATNRRQDGECDCNTDSTDTLKGTSRACLAMHAEVGALLDAASAGSLWRVQYAVTSRPPCKPCLTALLGTGVPCIVTGSDWPDRDGVQPMWENAGRIWIQL